MLETWSVAKRQITSSAGVVACQHVRAARAGAQVLARGGNAMDAAVTTALVLSVVEPWLSCIGGGGFLLHADPGGKVDALDFNVIASRNIDPKDYPLDGGRDGDWFNWPAVMDNRNLIGFSSICVPGAVAGLAAALERFGTISWSDALQPAIEEAERGVALDWLPVLAIAIDAEGLARYPASASLFLRNGRAPRVPEDGSPAFLPMTAKAKVLKRLAVAGARDFYEGQIARDLVEDLGEAGSDIDASDLAAYSPRWKVPLAQPYRDQMVHAMPGLSGGPTFMATLEELGSRITPGLSEAETALVYAQAIRRATEHRLRTLGHNAPDADSCTTHLSVVDREGRMVSLTNTLLSRFGSKVVLPKTGFLLNNGMMWFDPRPDQPNSIAAGKRPLANMCPILTTREGTPALALGGAGGRQIFPALIQLLSYVTDFGLSLEEAFYRPRIDASRQTIRVNRAAGSDVAEALKKHFPVEMVDDTLYPVSFAVTSAVSRRAGVNTGMAHVRSATAAACAEDDLLDTLASGA